ncbi:MAG TPA: SMP-30/gluconolactonase/LRE family protein [Steroidobacteraceae bacterium]|nr:SMP-30/gluconolactonase/LRE family protein [Steroidobacteraceae bacterium]
MPTPSTATEWSAAVAPIPGVVAAGAKLQLVGEGFKGTEGLIGMSDGSVLFCEIDTNRIIHLDLAGNASIYLEDSNRAIGLAYDARGRLIAAQSREPRIGVLAPTRLTLADSFAGQPLVRPNDLVVDQKGGLYFSDPIPSPQLQFRDPPPGRKPLLFYIRPDGTLTQLTDVIARPNGVQLSTDEKTLYAVDGDQIVAFDVQADGSVKNPRKFADATGDGLAVDSANRLYVATEAGVRVLSPKGRSLGLIPTPVRIQSVAFAGADRKTLYAAGRGKVFRISLLARGIASRAK